MCFEKTSAENACSLASQVWEKKDNAMNGVRKEDKVFKLSANASQQLEAAVKKSQKQENPRGRRGRGEISAEPCSCSDFFPTYSRSADAVKIIKMFRLMRNVPTYASDLLSN